MDCKPKRPSGNFGERIAKKPGILTVTIDVRRLCEVTERKRLVRWGVPGVHTAHLKKEKWGDVCRGPEEFPGDRKGRRKLIVN